MNFVKSNFKQSKQKGINWTIRKKFEMVVITLIISITLSIALQLEVLKDINTEWEQYRTETVTRQQYLMQINKQFGYGGFIHNFKNYVLRHQPKYYERFNKNKVLMFEAIHLFEKLQSLSNAEREAISAIKEVADEYIKNIEITSQLIAESKSPTEIDQVVKVDDSPAFDAFKLIEHHFQKLGKIHKREMNQLIHQMEKHIFIMLANALVIILIILPILHGIIKKIDGARNIIKQFSDGDLTAKFTIIGHDEIAEMLTDLNTAIGNLREIIAKNVKVAQSVSNATMQSASAFQETSASLEEITTLTKKNAENVWEVNDIMKETDSVAKKASQAIENLTDSMNDIAQTGEETLDFVKKIDEIAFQTSLLALNIAIEAARIGKTGTGFSVVASEVKNLAQHSAEVAKNTTLLIENMVQKMKAGALFIQTNNEVFKAIKTYTERTSLLVGEIATASNKQATGIEQINNTIADMDKVTQQNAVNSESLANSIAFFKVESC